MAVRRLLVGLRTIKMQEKLLKIQKEVPAIKKDSQNPHFKNKYFDINTLLEVVLPILNKHEVVLTQGLTHIEGKIALATKLSCKEGEVAYVVPLPECADAQKYGSAITYFRRYAIVSLLALEAEDDDGNTAKPPVKAVVGRINASSVPVPLKGDVIDL